jgi:hypothetical protein
MSGSGAPKIDSYDSQVDSYRGEQGRISAARGGRSGVRGRTRGNDEGTVYQRQDGRWVAAVRDVNGRRVYRYARTRAEAAAKLTLALKATAGGIALPPSTRPSFPAWKIKRAAAVAPLDQAVTDGPLSIVRNLG